MTNNSYARGNQSPSLDRCRTSSKRAASASNSSRNSLLQTSKPPIHHDVLFFGILYFLGHATTTMENSCHQLFAFSICRTLFRTAHAAAVEAQHRRLARKLICSDMRPRDFSQFAVNFTQSISCQFSFHIPPCGFHHNFGLGNLGGFCRHDGEFLSCS